MKYYFFWIFTLMFSLNSHANIYFKIRTYDRIINLTYWNENILPQNIKLGRNDSINFEYKSTELSMIQLLATFPFVPSLFLDVMDGDSILIEAKIDNVDIQFMNLGKSYRQRDLFEKKRLKFYDEWKNLGDKNSKMYIVRQTNVYWKIFESSTQFFNDFDENKNFILIEKFKALAGSEVIKAENGMNNSKALNVKILDSIVGFLEYDFLLNSPLAVNFLSRFAEAGVKYNSKELTYRHYLNYFKEKMSKSKAKDILLLKMSRYFDSTAISNEVIQDSTQFLNWSWVLMKLEESKQKQKSIALAKSNNYSKVITSNDTIIVLDSLLKAYSDKPVLIDIWASWCSPCIEEFKNYPDIFAKYANRINFIFLSIDKNHDSWRMAHKKYIKDEIEAQSVRVNFYDGKLYVGGRIIEVATIPRYIFLDKSSILIDSNAPKPSDPLFMKLIDRYID